MRREQAIELLKGEADALRARGATALYMFGSTARDAALDTSDIDLFIDFDPESGFTLLDLVAIQQHLQDCSAVTIDLTTRDALHPRLKDGIEASAIRVF